MTKKQKKFVEEYLIDLKPLRPQLELDTAQIQQDPSEAKT